jgi:hypothetical protein
VDNIVVESVSALISGSQAWTGTMTQLNKQIRKVIARSQRTYLPGSASALRKVINRNINRIRSRGVSVKFGRTPDRMRTRYVIMSANLAQ